MQFFIARGGDPTIEISGSAPKSAKYCKLRGLSSLGCTKYCKLRGLSRLGCTKYRKLRGLSSLGCTKCCKLRGSSGLGCTKCCKLRVLSSLGCTKYDNLRVSSSLGCTKYCKLRGLSSLGCTKYCKLQGLSSLGCTDYGALEARRAQNEQIKKSFRIQEMTRLKNLFFGHASFPLINLMEISKFFNLGYWLGPWPLGLWIATSKRSSNPQQNHSPPLIQPPSPTENKEYQDAF